MSAHHWGGSKPYQVRSQNHCTRFDGEFEHELPGFPEACSVQGFRCDEHANCLTLSHSLYWMAQTQFVQMFNNDTMT